MPILNGRNHQIQELQREYGQLYEAVLGICGTATTIFGFGDYLQGQPNATTFTSSGAEQVTGTFTTAPASLAAPLDLTQPSSYQGIIPYVTLATADRITFLDAAFWTTVATESFTVAVWVNPPSFPGDVTVFGKYDEDAPDREWKLTIDSNGYPGFYVYDETQNALIGREDQTSLGAGVWTFLAARYDGGTDAANIDVFVDAVETDDADIADDAAFATMVDGAGVPMIGAQDHGASYANAYAGKIAGGPLGPLFVDGSELSDDAILRLYNLGRRALGV